MLQILDHSALVVSYRGLHNVSDASAEGKDCKAVLVEGSGRFLKIPPEDNIRSGSKKSGGPGELLRLQARQSSNAFLSGIPKVHCGMQRQKLWPEDHHPVDQASEGTGGYFHTPAAFAWKRVKPMLYGYF